MYTEGFPHLNTYSTHNYIPVTNPVNKLFPNIGTMTSIMKRREEIKLINKILSYVIYIYLVK